MEMTVLRRRLQRLHGFSTLQFSYPTVRPGIGENARRLSGFIDSVPAERVDLVGHSLGGVLALQMLQRFPTGKVGRVVCLGSPLTGSNAARNFGRWEWSRKMLGRTIREAVLESPLEISDANHAVGVIAGNVGLGLGLIVGNLERPHDGMVTVPETRLPGITEHRVLAVNHIGLVFSRQVAAQTSHFLRNGAFR